MNFSWHHKSLLQFICTKDLLPASKLHLNPRRHENDSAFHSQRESSPQHHTDHIHGGEWTSWLAILNDIEPDRHRVGARSANRLKGTSNYLFADGHVENIRAADFKVRVEIGENPARVPVTP